ncbi:MAG TPA: FGGY family carbohydrate kinase [Chitinophagaceae bacterium]|nr:FGGY family carbohydrate kinase [Chitinophagaceae bacterium]
MLNQPVIAVIDVGKTNKKLFLFDEHYKIVYERAARFIETVDEDGDTCENLESLRLSVFDSLRDVFSKKEFHVKAINFSAYGASFVCVGEDGLPVAPLYNYLKPYPEWLKQQFYSTYGGEEEFSLKTASPVLGSLNSGMQLYRLKFQKPQIFNEVKCALHLPQYLSYLISGKLSSDITSIGCHTNLWNFQTSAYHDWVYREGLNEKLAPVVASDAVVPAAFPGNSYCVGVGLHDSSAALIPYLVSFSEPFVLISTGTWCISLNPFNQQPLTVEELKQDCLCYLSYEGKPVKASRLFAGQEHEEGVKRIADHFNRNPVHYRSIEYNPGIISKLNGRKIPGEAGSAASNIPFDQYDLQQFTSDEEAYHQLMLNIILQQRASTDLVLAGTKTKRIFVDGGFCKNSLYMNLLAAVYPDMEIFAASMAQATAMGTALAIHRWWNKKPLPSDIIELKYYSLTNDVVL